MAARGARSRKTVEKQIKKEEKKEATKGYISDLSKKASSPSGNWGIPSRPPSSQASQNAQVRRSGYSPSLRSIASGESRSGTQAPSEGSSETKPKEKYAAKGKGSKAPRGRGGGVPTKTSEMGNPKGRETPLTNINAPSRSLRTSASNLSRAGRSGVEKERIWSRYKIWDGPRHTRPYKGLEDDNDLWISSGDTLIYFGDETSFDDPRPSLRVHATVLDQANSQFLSHLIKYGEIQQENESDDNASRYDSGRASRDPSVLYLDNVSVTGGPGSASTSSVPYGVGSFLRQMPGVTNSAQGARFQATRSRATSDVGSTTVVGYDRPENAEPDITHEIWFRAPLHITKPEIQCRYHVATRNFLAMLYGKSLVGTDLYEMLSDLQNVLETYYELNELDDRRDPAQDIIYYLTERKMDDVRNNLRGALGLLAWCELPAVRWEEGYIETFVHCVGMMNSSTVDLPDFKALSRISRHNIQLAYESLQVRIIEAEERLAAFNFNDLWDVDGVAPNSAAARSFDAFRTFILNFYSRQYRGWPPKKEHGDRWLTRTVTRRLQVDLGSMYDYLVDRDVIWDMSEARAGRKWEIVQRIASPGFFSADHAGLPLTDMLVSFDYKHRYQHVPHPYPLLPQGSTAPKAAAPVKKGLFPGLKRAKTAAQRDPKEHFQTSLAFNGATNINRPGFPTDDNRLIDELQQHEKSLPSDIAPPTPARLGRWIMLYGLLEVLSTVSADTEGLRYTSDVVYFLCPSLAGIPPWQPSSDDNPPRYTQSSQERSYCWLAPVRWGEAKATPPAYDEQRTQYEQDEGADILSEIDGRTVTTIPGLASGNAIGMALFPDASDLSLGDKAGRFGRGDMKPSLPIRSSRRPINQAMTPEFPTPEQDYLGANGYFSNFR